MSRPPLPEPLGQNYRPNRAGVRRGVASIRAPGVTIGAVVRGRFCHTFWKVSDTLRFVYNSTIGSTFENAASSTHSHKSVPWDISYRKPGREYFFRIYAWRAACSLSIAICSRCFCRSASICFIASSPRRFCANRA